MKGSALLPLHSMQLFSSISATFGNPGQANYSAANAVLEATATYMQVMIQFLTCTIKCSRTHAQRLNMPTLV